MTAKPTGWVTVREQVAHPDHPDVVGDLCRHTETGHYQMLVYLEAADQYAPRTVPLAWAQRIARSTEGSGLVSESADVFALEFGTANAAPEGRS